METRIREPFSGRAKGIDVTGDMCDVYNTNYCRSSPDLTMASDIVLPAYLTWPARFCTFVTLITWINSILSSNVSQVDRIWTFMPTIYAAYFALLPLLPNKEQFRLSPYVPQELAFAQETFSPRALLMLGLIALWMCR